MSSAESTIAQILLKSKAVTLNAENPYTYSSGIRSPIYCDNRLLISDPATRKQVVDVFCEHVQQIKAKQIAGVATAGITWGAWIAERLNLPYIYVRPKPKGHGKEKQIEGNYIQESTVLIEDLVSTGGSSIQALDALRASGVPCETLIAIFTYGFSSAEQAFKEKKVAIRTLTNLDCLLKEGVAQKFFDEKTKSEVLRWRTDPQNWFQA